MVKLLKITGTIIATASILGGLVLLRKAVETEYYIIGTGLIVLGTVAGILFFALAKLILKIDNQNRMLEEIQDKLNANNNEKEKGETRKEIFLSR